MTGKDIDDRVIVKLIDLGVTRRWPTTDTILWINDGMQEIVRRRPDALSGTSVSKTNAVVEITALSETLPIHNRFRTSLFDWVMGENLEKDSEDVTTGARATYYRRRFERGL